MTTAQSILIVYGVVVLTYGFILGVPLAAVRTRQPQASRHLVNAHLSGIIQGGVHLGLAYAAGTADLTSWLVTTAAILVVSGSALELLGGTVNWLQATGDQFAERSLGFAINSLSGPPSIIGGAVLAIGVIVGV